MNRVLIVVGDGVVRGDSARTVCESGLCDKSTVVDLERNGRAWTGTCPSCELNHIVVERGCYILSNVNVDPTRVTVVLLCQYCHDRERIGLIRNPGTDMPSVHSVTMWRSARIDVDGGIGRRWIGQCENCGTVHVTKSTKG